ncbi:MAG: ABC transporter ATP-binding protein [Acidimicrobiia bacterium]|nr:ABC transporter ATP-binding protein [bacterium]MXX01977.1 ABC transporter ATP-binding protein [Acidimicrobiia bacterium]MXY74373.1 ABC transporter ATP-binding protein [Acidimicrobiia bacterium]MYA40161.1 ABC transporter ATP-binding protein [Acidimicrobiia bacterium]MYB79518.1 ABC transporter ATP-binding protein [Acidimicrobiia bacterium]
MASPLLSVRDLTTVIRTEGIEFEVVRGVSFDMYPNEILGLVGESGCGKTMTALSVMGLIPAPAARIAGGTVLFGDRDLVSLSERDMREVRGDDISMIFQDPLTSLDPMFRIGHLLTEVIRRHRPVSRSQAEAMALQALAEVELPDPETRMSQYPHQLSGGMRQRVMIAMALMLDPDILIADEPTTALDVTVQAQILDRLLGQQRRRGMSMLLITHDLGVVAAVADRVAVMYSGEIVEQAPVTQLFSDPQHPYTQGLLRAVPQTRHQRGALHTIPGRVPPPQFVPPGCPFSPRCSQALARCWEEHPDLVPENGRRLRCFNPQPLTPA